MAIPAIPAIPPVEAIANPAGTCRRDMPADRRAAHWRFAALDFGGNSYRDRFEAIDLCNMHAPHERRARQKRRRELVTNRDNWHEGEIRHQNERATAAILTRLRLLFGFGIAADRIDLWNVLEAATNPGGAGVPALAEEREGVTA